MDKSSRVLLRIYLSQELTMNSYLNDTKLGQIGFQCINNLCSGLAIIGTSEVNVNVFLLYYNLFSSLFCFQLSFCYFWRLWQYILWQFAIPICSILSLLLFQLSLVKLWNTGSSRTVGVKVGARRVTSGLLRVTMCVDLVGWQLGCKWSRRLPDW